MAVQVVKPAALRPRCGTAGRRSSMRIIAGAAKGRRLEAPPGLVTRPMTDQAREGVFSAVAPRLPGADVLDLYAGTGSLGLEALSRGAASAVFVERDHRALRVLYRNLAAVGLGGRAAAGEAARFLAGLRARGLREIYDLAFVDPPYEQSDDSVDAVLEALAPLLRAGGSALVHRRSDMRRPEMPGFAPGREYAYGTARIWRYEQTAASGERAPAEERR